MKEGRMEVVEVSTSTFCCSNFLGMKGVFVW